MYAALNTAGTTPIDSDPGFRHPGTYPPKKTHLNNMSALLFVLPIIKHFIQFIVAEPYSFLSIFIQYLK